LKIAIFEKQTLVVSQNYSLNACESLHHQRKTSISRFSNNKADCQWQLRTYVKFSPELFGFQTTDYRNLKVQKYLMKGGKSKKSFISPPP